MEKGFILLLPVVIVVAVVGGFALLLVVGSGIVLDMIGVEGVYILLLLLGLLCLVRVGIWLWQSIGLARARVRAENLRAQFIAPDERGLLPVHAGLLMQPQFGAATMTIHAASQGGGSAAAHLLPQPAAAALPTLTAPALQSFADLYQSHQLPDNGFLMGYSLEDGQPITAGWRDLYSALIGGQSGSGKSTLIRSILAQSALQGGRFVVLDKHYGAGDESLGESLQPLRHLMLCDVAADEAQMIDALSYVRTIGEQRLSGQSKDKSPIVLIVDETTALLQRSDVAPLLTDVLGEISQETRKVGVFALCIGQQFHSSVMDTVVRNSFVSFIGCRMRKDVARVMTGDNEFGKMAQGLSVGQAVWMTPGGIVHRLAVPNCTAHDLDLVARQIPAQNTQPETKRALPLGKASAETSAKASAKASAADRDDDSTNVDSAPGTALDARSLRVLEMMAQGSTQTDIIAEVWKVTGKGNDYKKASAEHREMMQKLAQHLLGGA